MNMFDGDDDADDGRPDLPPRPDSLAAKRLKLLHELDQLEGAMAADSSPEDVAAEVEAKLPVAPFDVVRDLAGRVDAPERTAMSHYACTLTIARDVNAPATVLARDGRLP